MRITLKTYGGIAAAIPSKPHFVDTSLLSKEVEQQWIQLVEAALASTPASPTASPRPDMMGYTLTIEDGEGGARTLKLRDGELTAAAAALVSRLRSAT